MKLEHVIPANTLSNGQYYNAIIYTIDSSNDQSNPSYAVPFYCFSQPTLSITNMPTTGLIQNGTYLFEGSYSQIEGESLNSYQFTLYNTNREILSQSSLIYYESDSSLSYSFSGMDNNVSYYIELSGQTVNNTKITTGLIFFTVRYLKPASFAICDLVNNCEDGYVQISSNIVAIDGVSEPTPPVYIDNKEVDLTREGSWVKWDTGFNIQNDFTLRAFGRNFDPYEPIITLKNNLDTDNIPNRIEMKWMIGDIIKSLPQYVPAQGFNVSLTDSKKGKINSFVIGGNSIQKIVPGTVLSEGESVRITDKTSIPVQINVNGNEYQETVQGEPGTTVSGEDITINNVNINKELSAKVNGNNKQETRNGKNLFDFQSLTYSESSSQALVDKTTETIQFIKDTRRVIILNLSTSIPSGTHTFIFELETKNTSIDNFIAFQLRYESGSAYTIATAVTRDKNATKLIYVLETDKEIKQMYGFISSNEQDNCEVLVKNIMVLSGSYTVDNLPAYEKYGVMPSPEYPSEVETVGKGYNLWGGFTFSKISNGITYRFNKDGTLDLSGTSTVTGSLYSNNTNDAINNNLLVTLGAGDYCVSGGQANIKLQVVTESGSVIGTTSTATGKTTFTLNSTTRVFVRSHIAGTIDQVIPPTTIKILLVKGTTEKPYQPYGQGNVTIETSNKNELRYTLLTSRTTNGLTVTNNNNGTYTINGTATAQTILAIDNLLLDTAKKYKLSGCPSGGSSSTYYIAGANYADYGNGSSYVVPNRSTNIAFSIVIQNGTICNNIIFKPMLSEIDSNIFEPHKGETITLPVQKEMLQGDSFEKVGGVWKEKHLWGKVVLDGTEDWIYAASKVSYQTTGAFPTDVVERTLSTRAYSSHYKYGYYSSGISSNIKDGEFGWSGVKVLTIGNRTITNVNDFKTWLATNKPVIYYPLAETEYLDCTSEQITILDQLQSLTPYETTHIYSTDILSPIFEVTYNKVTAMPSPEKPSEVKTVGKGINLAYLNEVTSTSDGYMNLSTHTFAEVVAGQTYTISFDIDSSNTSTGNTYVRTYTGKDSGTNQGNEFNFNRLAGGGKYTKTFTAKYSGHLSFNGSGMLGNSKVFYNIQVEKGERATSYQPYGQGNITIETSNKNELKYPYATNVTKVNGITFTDNGDGTVTVEGTATANAYFNYYKNEAGARLPIKAGTHTLSANAIPTGCQISIGVRDKNGNAISGVSSFYLSPTTLSSTKTVNQDFEIFAYIQVPSGSVVPKTTINLQLEQGSTATSYVPYQGQTFNLPTQKEMLTGDSFIKSEQWKEKHIWGKKILDGTENWNRYAISGSTDKYYFYAYDIMNNVYFQNSVFIGISNIGVASNTGRGDEGLRIILYNNRVATQIYSDETKNMTVNEFKTWLSNNNTTVYYKLAEPELLNCTLEQTEVLNQLYNFQLYSDETNIWSDNDPSPIFKVNLISLPSPDLKSPIYNTGDNKNQLDINDFNIEYSQAYYQARDTGFELIPNNIYSFSFEYDINEESTELYYSIGYGEDSYEGDILESVQYTNQTSGINYSSFTVPSNLPSGKKLWIKFAKTVILADINVDIKKVSLTQGKEYQEYQSPNLYNIYLTKAETNLYNKSQTPYIITNNVNYTETLNGYNISLNNVGQESYLAIGLKDILETGSDYSIYYNFSGDISDFRLYATDKGSQTIVEQIAVDGNGKFVAPDGVYDLQMRFYLNNSTVGNNAEIWNIAIEKGNKTEFAIYNGETYPLVLDRQLRGIGIYKDIICMESINLLNPLTQNAIVEENTEFYFSQKGNINYNISYVNIEGNVISSSNIVNGIITTPANCHSITINNASGTDLVNNLVQISYGDREQVYYPYISEPSLIKYITEKTLDGSEDWKLNGDVFYLESITDYQLRDNSPLCDYFRGIENVSVIGDLAEYNNVVTFNKRDSGDPGDKFYLKSSSFSTVADLKSWLQNNNVKLYYVKDVPTIESLDSSIISTLSNIQTNEPITSMFTDNNSIAELNFDYINNYAEDKTQNAYVLLKCYNENTMPYVIHSNYIDIPSDNEKVFIWLRRDNNLFDLKIENLGVDTSEQNNI